jgi:hypothetical protein
LLVFNYDKCMRIAQPSFAWRRASMVAPTLSRLVAPCMRGSDCIEMTARPLACGAWSLRGVSFARTTMFHCRGGEHAPVGWCVRSKHVLLQGRCRIRWTAHVRATQEAHDRPPRSCTLDLRLQTDEGGKPNPARHA